VNSNAVYPPQTCTVMAFEAKRLFLLITLKPTCNQQVAGSSPIASSS